MTRATDYVELASDTEVLCRRLQLLAETLDEEGGDAEAVRQAVARLRGMEKVIERLRRAWY